MKHFVFALLLLSCFSSIGQNRRNSFNRKYKFHHNTNIDWVGTVGIAMGGENLISLPKLSGYGSLSVGNYRKVHGNFSRNSFYFGGEASLFLVIAGAFSIAGTTGFKAGPATLDCNLNRLILTNPDGDIAARQTTVNPKIGWMIGPVWLKAGPSFLISNTPIWTEITGGFMQIKDTPLNFEVTFNMSWQKY